MYSKSNGFTLLEVLIAVVILGLVATGSLRLMMMSSRAMAEVEEARDLLNEARGVQLDFMTDDTKPTSGVEKKIKWGVKEGSWVVLDGQWEFKFRVLTVETVNNEIVLYIPSY